jgi:hypothetical protein
MYPKTPKNDYYLGKMASYELESTVANASSPFWKNENRYENLMEVLIFRMKSLFRDENKKLQPFQLMK